MCLPSSEETRGGSYSGQTEGTPAKTPVKLRNGQNYVKTTTWKVSTLRAVGFTCGGHLTGAKARRTATDTANTQKK